MGLFGFRKKEKKTYTIDIAAAEIQKELESIQGKNKAQMENTAQRIRSELNQLLQLVKEFAAKETPEFAKRSENVKERFCAIAAKQLESLPDGIEVLQYAGDLMNNMGGLTQRQILHINVFFKEGFSPIGRKMKEIEQLLKLDNVGGDYSRATELYHRMKSAEVKMNGLDDPSSLEKDVEKLKRKLEEEKNAGITEPDDSELLRARKSIGEIKQDIDSFLPVQKLLKKYAYAKQLKDSLIDAYINSPSSALLLDEYLKIIEYVAEASVMFSELNEAKRDAILRGRLLLGEKRKVLEQAIEKERQEGGKYMGEKEKSDNMLSEKQNRISSLEHDIKEASKHLEELAAEKKELEEELNKTREDFCGLAGKLLGANVTILS